MKENIIQEKTYEFAKRIMKLYQVLKSKNEFDLTSQILRSGTSIGANVEEALGAQSKKDFFHKISISYKEARETKYWLRLLKDTGYIEVKLANVYLKDCEELLKIIGSIQKSIKESLNS